MRALRSCDFCGADAVGTFEIVPPELEPTEAEQRRVVLCGECQHRLEALLEPLLARVGAGGVNRETEPKRVSALDDVNESGGVERTVNTVDRTPVDTPSTTPDEAEPTAVADDEDGITFVHDEPTKAVVTESADSSEETESPGESSSDEGDSNGDSDTTRSEPERRPPKAYGNVVRLLRNREFPMERRAVLALAAGAYDLEAHEAEAVVEYAVSQGELLEAGDELRRP